MGEKQGFDASLMKPANLAELRTTLIKLLNLHCEDEDLHTQATASNTENNLMPTGNKKTDTIQLPMQRPPADELEQAILLVEIGAITDLTEWADGLTNNHPEYAEFSQQMISLLAQARFDDILALCQIEQQS